MQLPAVCRLAVVLPSSVLLLTATASRPAAAQPPIPGWSFTEVAAQVGLDYEHGLSGPVHEPELISGGVAVGDFDGDGWLDLYAVRGNVGPNLLLRNRGDGTFEEGAAAAGVAIDGEFGCGPAFADYDGDGDLDLWVGGVAGSTPHLYRNRGDGTFEDVIETSNIFLPPSRNTLSATFGDYDRDGDLDLALGHWTVSGGGTGHLYRNRGDHTFEDVDAEAGLDTFYRNRDFSFSPNFADFDGDGWLDLLMANDFGTSRIFRNQGDGTFRDVTDPAVVTDENGMGAAVADYDADGDLDWFVSSIWDPDGMAEGNWGITGNRLYRNRGDGTFEDFTGEAGVRRGYWGWGSCFADFDNDGDLDLFHVNGFPVLGADEYHLDPARLFLGRGDGTFVESSAALGIDERGQGRGISCFDYDNDGDLDVLVANNSGPLRLYRNDLPPGNHHLAVRLRARAPNTQGAGARVWATAGGQTQMREIRIGTNFVSQDPPIAHFGLGPVPRVEELRIRWPDGEETILRDVAAGRTLEADQEALTGALAIPTLGGWGLAVLAGLLAVAGLWPLRRR